MGMAGMVTPSRISHHLGISKAYGTSGLPSVILTSRVSMRSNALRAEATLSSEPHSISLIASATASSVRKRSEEHTSELQSQSNLVCRLLLEKKKKNN